ncbi:MAG: hypothetical protein AB7O28_21150, partial [Vicinamibacterales bacterium]
MATRRSTPSTSAALFLAAYTCSGLAGLVYEVTWTRLLTLHLGHTTAAGSAVVGAFLLGLALGAALMGRPAAAFTPSQALRTYALLEVSVGGVALALAPLVAALTPVLRWAYEDGAPGLVFGVVRVLVAVVLVMTPATALGATFPLAIRWFASESAGRTRLTAMLYAANTLGAAAGALLAGFVLVPRLGVHRTILCGVAAGAVSAALALLASRQPAPADAAVPSPPPARGRRGPVVQDRETPPRRLGLAAGVLALSGLAALLHELAWTRILALAIGPTTYAFAAALAAVIAGSAAGAWIGTWLVGRVRAAAGA